MATPPEYTTVWRDATEKVKVRHGMVDTRGNAPTDTLTRRTPVATTATRPPLPCLCVRCWARFTDVWAVKHHQDACLASPRIATRPV